MSMAMKWKLRANPQFLAKETESVVNEKVGVVIPVNNQRFMGS